MSEYDLLIVTIYLIVVTSILSQSINAIPEQITVKFEQANFKQQLTEQNIEGLVEVKFDLKERYDIDELRQVGINIKNNSSQDDIYIDWENCCLIGTDGRTQRVVRLTPSMTLNLFQPQVGSVIAPGKVLKEQITAETVLKRDTETSPFKPASPLINPAQLKPKSPSNPWSTFSLRLVLRLSDPTTTAGAKRSYSLYCPLSVRKLHWTSALPWFADK